MNVVILSGRLTRDPERSTASTGMAITRFSLAIDRAFRKGDSGNDTADFIRIVCFDKRAEFAEKYLKKGSKVAVEGRIQTGSYAGKDGKTVYTTDVIANNIEFMDSKRSDGGDNFGGQFSSPQNDFSQKPANEPPDSFAEVEDEDDEMPF